MLPRRAPRASPRAAGANQSEVIVISLQPARQPSGCRQHNRCSSTPAPAQERAAGAPAHGRTARRGSACSPCHSRPAALTRRLPRQCWARRHHQSRPAFPPFGAAPGARASRQACARQRAAALRVARTSMHARPARGWLPSTALPQPTCGELLNIPPPPLRPALDGRRSVFLVTTPGLCLAWSKLRSDRSSRSESPSSSSPSYSRRLDSLTSCSPRRMRSSSALRAGGQAQGKGGLRAGRERARWHASTRAGNERGSGAGCWWHRTHASRFCIFLSLRSCASIFSCSSK